VPTPGVSTTRYGGNTACVEILVGNQRIIFDGGTGLRALGEKLNHLPDPVKAHLFFTHTEWDRIQGFPFFLPAFSPRNDFKIYGATALNGASIKQRLSEQMLRPNFSIPLQDMQARLEFFNISAGSVIQIEDVLIETFSLNQHNGALGYRLNWNNRVLVYATDTDDQKIDKNLVYLAQQADILIYDGTYADLAYQTNVSNSSLRQPWQTALTLASTAGVRQLILFHHSPMQTDSALDELSAELRQSFPNVILAQEGMSLEL
jgi:phosphoribosyl 1,2-cyclic phosphodiesterase